MRFSLLLIILFCSVINTAAQQNTDIEKKAAQLGITGFFDGLSALDTAMIRTFCTGDVMILEHGLLWNFDSLAKRIAGGKKPADYKRINEFDFLETHIKEDVAWLYYLNKATITANNKTRIVKWLESAVLRKEKNGWKIHLLHSTKTE